MLFGFVNGYDIVRMFVLFSLFGKVNPPSDRPCHIALFCAVEAGEFGLFIVFCRLTHKWSSAVLY
jgi:hypothetical protein